MTWLWADKSLAIMSTLEVLEILQVTWFETFAPSLKILMTLSKSLYTDNQFYLQP